MSAHAPVPLQDVTDEQVDEEVARVVGALAQKAFRLNEELGHFGGQPIRWDNAPICDSIRLIFAAATGEDEPEQEADLVYEHCQTLCELLWCPPMEANYRVPVPFWDTLLGQAIRVFVGEPPSGDNEELTIAQAARLGQVARMTVHRAVESGRLPVARMAGSRRIFRAGDVRAWLQVQQPDTEATAEI